MSAEKTIKPVVVYAKDRTHREMGKVTESQLNGLLNQNSTRLRDDLTYYACAQYVHPEDLARPFNGYTTSQKFFFLGCDKNGIAKEITTLSLNGLRQTHYGRIDANPNLTIATTVENGKHRSSARQISLIRGGKSMPISGDKSKESAYISRPFGIKVVGRSDVYVPQFNKIGENSWDLKTKIQDGKEVLDLTYQTVNEYELTDTVPDDVMNQFNEIEDLTDELKNVPQA